MAKNDLTNQIHVLVEDWMDEATLELERVVSPHSKTPRPQELASQTMVTLFEDKFCKNGCIICCVVPK